MLVVTTWLWGRGKFDEKYVAILAASVARNLSQPYRFVCFTDSPRKLPDGVAQIRIPNLELLLVRGCFARLRLFDPAVQQKLGADRILNIDLDTVITDSIDPLIDRPEPFVIMQGGNAANPCPLNGALMMLRAGAHSEVWSDFTIDAARQTQYYEFPDDQGWLWAKVPDAAGWECGPSSGVYVFRKTAWGNRDDGSLPQGARLVTFNGSRSPDKFKHLPWVKENWRT